MYSGRNPPEFLEFRGIPGFRPESVEEWKVLQEAQHKTLQPRVSTSTLCHVPQLFASVIPPRIHQEVDNEHWISQAPEKFEFGLRRQWKERGGHIRKWYVIVEDWQQV